MGFKTKSADEQTAAEKAKEEKALKRLEKSEKRIKAMNTVIGGCTTVVVACPIAAAFSVLAHSAFKDEKDSTKTEKTINATCRTIYDIIGVVGGVGIGIVAGTAVENKLNETCGIKNDFEPVKKVTVGGYVITQSESEFRKKMKKEKD